MATIKLTGAQASLIQYAITIAREHIMEALEPRDLETATFLIDRYVQLGALEARLSEFLESEEDAAIWAAS